MSLRQSSIALHVALGAALALAVAGCIIPVATGTIESSEEEADLSTSTTPHTMVEVGGSGVTLVETGGEGGHGVTLSPVEPPKYVAP